MPAQVFDRFVIQAPFAVMTRVLIQDFIGSDLDRVFDSNRSVQYEHIASFQAHRGYRSRGRPEFQRQLQPSLQEAPGRTPGEPAIVLR